ncbi:tRNA pseudouridine(55) synthase TruB [Wolbachia endosymbiont of Folsomia candida]|uniref:tRNA pseudouridine(55) synthase TruB n=1 Tax=Wolbachia endosymbiont of Folsomia candida TaxID=169402 RepID=UPI000B607BA0|nr:tRNA pseudouridine(55) synthase TruB [Wolbachia endosymbiont of Folsomia candida]APR99220.1 tRNA pseudouridine(55) synthase TruB [Wolbachia endosymbiont of Folsomia candida]
MIHGWLNLNKPIGISSAQAVNQIKKIFDIKKAGHLGTLDPLAFGVLPVALGEATKTIPYLSSDLKAYDFTVKWGEQRTTDDLDGEAMRSSTIEPKYDQINCAIKNFVGEITQTPPAFSAVKINGARAYKLSRNGQKVDIKSRLVYIHELELIAVDTAHNSADFSMVCGSGVYVRSIARDLGIALNCFGHVIKLKRTMVGDFRDDESVTIEQLINSMVSSQPTISSQYNPLSSKSLFSLSSQCVTLGSRYTNMYKSYDEKKTLGTHVKNNVCDKTGWIPASRAGMTLGGTAMAGNDTGMTEGDVVKESNAENFVIPIESSLKSMLKVEISAEEARKIRDGQEITLNNLCNLNNYDICYTIVGNVPIAICSFIYGSVKPIRVFNI